MIHRVSRKVIPIPTHGNKDIGVGLLRKIIRDTAVSVEEWQEL